MCGQAYQLGMPLSEDVLELMDEEERGFWRGFLKEADEEIKWAENMGEKGRLVPSRSLRGKYDRALNEFKGSDYCQVRQLQGIFVFSVS